MHGMTRTRGHAHGVQFEAILLYTGLRTVRPDRTHWQSPLPRQQRHLYPTQVSRCRTQWLCNAAETDPAVLSTPGRLRQIRSQTRVVPTGARDYVTTLATGLDEERHGACMKRFF